MPFGDSSSYYVGKAQVDTFLANWDFTHDGAYTATVGRKFATGHSDGGGFSVYLALKGSVTAATSFGGMPFGSAAQLDATMANAPGGQNIRVLYSDSDFAYVLGLTSGSALFLGMKDTLCGSNANINTATLAMPHRAPNKMLNFGQNNHVYMLTQHFDRHQYSGGGNTVTIDIARDKGAGGRECNWDNVQANGSCDHTRPIVGGADTECWQNDHPNPWNPVCRNGANCWGNGDIMLNAESDGATDSTSTSSNDADCQSQAGEGGARNCCQGLGDNFGWYYDAGSAQNFASGDQHYHCNRKRPGYIPGMCAHMNLSPSHGP